MICGFYEDDRLLQRSPLDEWRRRYIQRGPARAAPRGLGLSHPPSLKKHLHVTTHCVRKIIARDKGSVRKEKLRAKKKVVREKKIARKKLCAKKIRNLFSGFYVINTDVFYFYFLRFCIFIFYFL